MKKLTYHRLLALLGFICVNEVNGAVLSCTITDIKTHQASDMMSGQSDEQLIGTELKKIDTTKPGWQTFDTEYRYDEESQLSNGTPYIEHTKIDRETGEMTKYFSASRKGGSVQLKAKCKKTEAKAIM